MRFLMDSKGTGNLHVKQKQSTAVITYVSKTQSETPVLCSSHFKTFVGITEFRFFSSISEDRYYHENQQEKVFSCKQLCILSVLNESYSKNSGMTKP